MNIPRMGADCSQEQDMAQSAHAAESCLTDDSNLDALIEAKNVSFEYVPNVPVLNNISFKIMPGELVVLLGPNGAGKSTLLNCILNLLIPQKGKILLDGQVVSSLSQRSIAQKVAYVAQSVDMAFEYTVRDYVAMGRTPHLQVYESPTDSDYELVKEGLNKLGILELEHRIYTELSGGQKQLVNVARAIVQKPQAILFDEPTSALDHGNQIKVLKLLKEMSQNEGYAILMTTHNPDHPILLDSSVCLLDRDGDMITGSIDEVMQEDLLEEIYNEKLLIRKIADAKRKVCITPTFE